MRASSIIVVMPDALSSAPGDWGTVSRCAPIDDVRLREASKPGGSAMTLTGGRPARARPTTRRPAGRTACSRHSVAGGAQLPGHPVRRPGVGRARRVARADGRQRPYAAHRRALSKGSARWRGCGRRWLGESARTWKGCWCSARARAGDEAHARRHRAGGRAPAPPQQRCSRTPRAGRRQRRTRRRVLDRAIRHANPAPYARSGSGC